jgi:hypothetical protein
MDNYPVGAKDDPRAPYNEPLTKDEPCDVSISFSFTDEYHNEKSRDYYTELIENAFRYFPNLNIDEIHELN